MCVYVYMHVCMYDTFPETYRDEFGEITVLEFHQCIQTYAHTDIHLHT